MPYYEDLHIKIYNKDCRSMNELSDGSVQCVVTSPPYWGLRKYSGLPDLIWGGDEKCEHQWEVDKSQTRVDRPWDSKSISSNVNEQYYIRSDKAFCSLCGAWKGAYGLESTPELYIQHTIEILREIRRALRKDGVVFLNLGDSYSSGDKHPNQSLENVPSYGNGDKEFLNWKECGCACSCHDDERQDYQLSHNAHNGQRLGREISQCDTKDHNKQLVDFSLESADGVPHASQESNKHASSQVSQENPSVLFCSDCLKCHYLASNTSNPLGTLYHIPKLKAKDLCLIPFRVAISAQEDGWWVRSVIIWSKPNPMPESVTDRPTESHEYILMLTKSKNYYWDADAVREPQQMSSLLRATRGWEGDTDRGYPNGPQSHIDKYFNKSYEEAMTLPGRNIRTVWEFPTQPYPEAHFAVFPEKLPETCIKAVTPEVGCCSRCGAPYERVSQRQTSDTRPGRNTGAGKSGTISDPNQALHTGDLSKYRQQISYETLGWHPTCKCNADKVPSIILDPFMGSGTTLWVAKKLGRNAVGYELSEEYCRLAVERNRQQVLC